MAVKSVIGKMVKVMVNPRLFWQRYDFESLSAKDLHGKVYPLIILAFFLITLFGSTLNSMADNGFSLVLLDVFVNCIMLSAAYVLSAYVQYKVCNLYGPTIYVKSAVYSLMGIMPYYLIYALLSIFPSLFFLWILVAYCLFVMYFGAKHFLKISEEKLLIFVILSVVINILGIVLAILFDFFIIDMAFSIVG